MKTLKIISILFILIFLFLYIPYEIFIADDKDSCLDSGFCKEGLSLNIENEKIIVNKQTCTQYGGIWLDRKNICQFNSQFKN